MISLRQAWFYPGLHVGAVSKNWGCEPHGETRDLLTYFNAAVYI